MNTLEEKILEKILTDLAEKLENLKKFTGELCNELAIEKMFRETIMYVQDICMTYYIEYSILFQTNQDLTIELSMPFSPHWLHIHVRNNVLYVRLC